MVSWFLAVAEAIGVWRFGSWAYGLGPRIIRESRPLPRPSGIVPLAEVFETPNGKFKLIAHDHCLFRDHFRYFRFNTPFPIKGSIRWHGGGAEIEGRLPLFTLLFFGAWFVGWGVGGIMATMSSEDLMSALGFLLFGWVFAGGLVALSIPLEVRRARRTLDELHTVLGSPAA